MTKPLLFISLIILTSQLLHAQSFHNQASSLGVGHSFGIHNMGGGCSFVDFDGDGWDDLSFATQQGDSIQFYHNEQTHFSKVHFPGLVHTGQSEQIIWVDYDNDGDQDCFVTAVDGPNTLYKNTGNMNFQDVSMAAGFPIDNRPSYAACWADIDRDGWLDVYITHREPTNTSITNYLYRNKGDGTFEDITISSGVKDAGHVPLAVVFADLNQDLYPDIYIAQDKFIGNTLYENNGDGTFTDRSSSSGAGLEMDGMGITAGDYDKDGDLDLYVANSYSGNRFLRNDGNFSFTEIGEDIGVALYGTAWGMNFFDVDHDRDLDLYTSALYFATSTQPGSMLFENLGQGTYQNSAIPMMGNTAKSYGNALGDWNHDGYYDIAVCNVAPDSSHLWVMDQDNLNNNHHWIKMRLQGTISNRDGVGSWIEVHTGGEIQNVYTQRGTSYLSQNSQDLIVGLGTATQVDKVVVSWPSGTVDTFEDMGIDQSYTFLEGSSTTGIEISGGVVEKGGDYKPCRSIYR